VTVGLDMGWDGKKGKQTSLLPLPNPFTTSPLIRSGNGGSGPESGPMIVGRGPSGRIFVSFQNSISQLLSLKPFDALIVILLDSAQHRRVSNTA
jgi:hypothetical protein